MEYLFYYIPQNQAKPKRMNANKVQNIFFKETMKSR